MKNRQEFERILNQIREKKVRGDVSLFNEEINDDDMTDLVDALSQNTQVTSLQLLSNHVSDNGSKCVANISTLQSLLLENNRVGPAGAEALANNNALRLLNLANNNIGDLGANYFEHNTTLKSLFLQNNEIGSVGSQSLARNKSIRYLNLSCNEAGNLGAKALADNTTLSFLSLWSNKVGDYGAECLSKNMILRSLNLGSNEIGDKGAQALAASTTLTSLDLSMNIIGDLSAQYFINNNSLTSLSLWGNRISEENKRKISRTLIRNRENSSKFLSACREGDQLTVKQMLDRKIVSPYSCVHTYADDDDSKPKEFDTQYTSLHLAVEGGHYELVAYLVNSYPGLLSLTDKDNKTAMMMAKERNDVAMQNVLSGESFVGDTDTATTVPRFGFR